MFKNPACNNLLVIIVVFYSWLDIISTRIDHFLRRGIMMISVVVVLMKIQTNRLQVDLDLHGGFLFLANYNTEWVCCSCIIS
jgi:hypothetical protein